MLNRAGADVNVVITEQEDMNLLSIKKCYEIVFVNLLLISDILTILFSFSVKNTVLDYSGIL